MIPRLYPGATTILTPEAMGVGILKPVGVTIHYTGGGDLAGTRRILLEKNLGYHIVIAKNGEVIQFTYFDMRVNHAGRAIWNGKSPNRSHIAVSLQSHGLLSHDDTGYHSWCGTRIDSKAVKTRPGTMSRVEYPWDAATKAQETSLLRFLKWICSYGIDPDNICGHDEAALPCGRKVDPGGVLSMTVSDIRKSLT